MVRFVAVTQLTSIVDVVGCDANEYEEWKAYAPFDKLRVTTALAVCYCEKPSSGFEAISEQFVVIQY